MGDGSWVAGCGSLQDITSFVECLKTGKAITEKLDVTLFHIGPDFFHRYEENGLPIKLDVNEKLTCGTGWQWALAAMDLALNARDAIEYAKTRDVWTGGEVNHVQIR